MMMVFTPLNDDAIVVSLIVANNDIKCILLIMEYEQISCFMMFFTK